MPPLTPGDRVRTANSGEAIVLRPNRLDPDSWIVWPDSWGRRPVDIGDGPGMSQRATTLTRLESGVAPTRPRRPNPSLVANAQPQRSTPEGPTR